MVAAGSTTGPVHVTTPVGPVAGPTFTVDPSPVPTIKSFGPKKAHVGSKVNLNGTGFWGASVVQVNGVDVQSFEVKSDKKIAFVVAGGNTTGLILGDDARWDGHQRRPADDLVAPPAAGLHWPSNRGA